MKWLMAVPLAGGVFIGLSALFWFMNLVVLKDNLPILFSMQVLAAASAVMWVRKIDFDLNEHTQTKRVSAVLLILLAVNMSLFAMNSIFHPFGDWDALMIWNLHARLLATLGDQWRWAFSPALFWSHPDYPLLVPGFIAMFWRAMGQAALVPIALSLFFFTATIALLHGATGRSALATCLLLSTPAFCFMGANQCADVPVGFYLLGSLTLLLLHERTKSDGLLMGSGLMIGLAAWTKNEGLLFVIALLAARTLVLLRTAGLREAVRQLFWIGSGLLAPIAVCIFFKTRISTQSDIILGLQNGGLWQRITNPARWLLITQQFVITGVTFGSWLVSPVPLLVAMVAIAKKRPAWNAPAATIALTIIFTLAGFFAIYLAMAEDLGALAQRLFFALGRLFLQLWPAMLLLFAMQYDKPENEQDQVGNQKEQRAE